MSYSSQLARERILECARQEFMEQSYQNALRAGSRRDEQRKAVRYGWLE